MQQTIIILRLIFIFCHCSFKYCNALAATKSNSLKALVLQLYGTGNMPSIKDTMIRTLQHATQNGILVVAATQCHIGSVVLGHYLTGQALSTIGVSTIHRFALF